MFSLKIVFSIATALTLVTARPVGSQDYSSLGSSDRHLSPTNQGDGFSGGLQSTESKKNSHDYAKNSATEKKMGMVEGVKMERFLVPQFPMYF